MKMKGVEGEEEKTNISKSRSADRDANTAILPILASDPITTQHIQMRTRMRIMLQVQSGSGDQTNCNTRVVKITKHNEPLGATVSIL